MKCLNCSKLHSADELDLDGLCYSCANYDPHYTLDGLKLVQELVENTIEAFARIKKVSALKVKIDLVAEHIYKNPGKYVGALSSSPKKKPTNKN